MSARIANNLRRDVERLLLADLGSQAGPAAAPNLRSRPFADAHCVISRQAVIGARWPHDFVLLVGIDDRQDTGIAGVPEAAGAALGTAPAKPCYGDGGR